MVKKRETRKYFERAVALTKKDFENARKVNDEQSIRPITEKNMFRAGIYCILSAAQDFTTHTKIYHEILKNELDAPENILESKPKLKRIIKKTRFPNEKYKRICGFAEWWPESNMAEKIMNDIDYGRAEEFNIRELLAEDAPGISRKCASLFLTKFKYDNIVPIDLWVLRALESWGCDVRVSDYKTVSGLSKKEYISYEKIFSDYAKEYGVSPAIFQAAIWAKYSKWKDTTQNTTLEKYI